MSRDPTALAAIAQTATGTATRIGVDVGGTFTDVILQRPDGRATIRKLLSTPPSYDEAVVRAVADLARGEDVAAVVHGDDSCDERRARAARRADRARDDRRLPRRARAAAPPDPAHVRPVLAQAAAARPAPPPLRGERTR